jgi:DNA integrity scanning protein DisA with diadenylate cyclase activity
MMVNECYSKQETLVQRYNYEMREFLHKIVNIRAIVKFELENIDGFTPEFANYEMDRMIECLNVFKKDLVNAQEHLDKAQRVKEAEEFLRKEKENAAHE